MTDCPTCTGPTRETVDMVCPTCGTDYARDGWQVIPCGVAHPGESCAAYETRLTKLEEAARE